MSAAGHLGQSCMPTVEREVSAKLSGQEKKKKNHRVRVDQIPRLKDLGEEQTLTLS